MIDFIIYTFLLILSWIFGLFPTITFDLSTYIGTFLYWINGYHSLLPIFFDTFFRTIWIGNVLAYIAIINVIILRILPVYKH